MSDLHDRENTLAAKKLELRELLAAQDATATADRAATALEVVEVAIVKVDDQLDKARVGTPVPKPVATPAPTPSPATPPKSFGGSKSTSDPSGAGE